MDVNDIFRQLTCGAKLIKNKFKNNKNVNVKNEVYKDRRLSMKENGIMIKDEKLSDNEEDNVNDFLNVNGPFNKRMQYFNDIQIKEEIKSEDESSDSGNGLTLLNDLPAPQLKKKKKKEMSEKKRKLLVQEELNHFRNKNHINVLGNKVPKPYDNFVEMAKKYQMSENLITNLCNCGYTEPTPIQMQAMPAMFEERSILGCAPTGSGKTAAFLIPIIKQLVVPKRDGFRALIVCPTRELAKQIQRECFRLTENLNFNIHVINKMNIAEKKFGAKSNKNYDILITTPNRLCFLLKTSPPTIDLSRVEWLILDEADKLFEDGKTAFRDQFDTIYNCCSNPDKKIGLFSATYTDKVGKWFKQQIKKPLIITIGQRNTAISSVNQELLFVGSENGKLLALRDLIRKGIEPPVLIFVQSKDRAQQLYNELLYDGINIDVIHSERQQKERDTIIRSFREGKIWLLICTELMGRGLDFKSINLIINYDFPKSKIDYIHRIGRTGRAGRLGNAITFFTHLDIPNLRLIANVIKTSGGKVPEYMLKMKKISKREIKRRQVFAPKRDDITTKSILLKNKRYLKEKLQRQQEKLSKSATGDKATEKSINQINKNLKSIGNNEKLLKLAKTSRVIKKKEKFVNKKNKKSGKRDGGNQQNKMLTRNKKKLN